MEPRKVENPVESHGEAPPSPPRPEEKRRRFRIVKLEERIAPSNGDYWKTHNKNCTVYTCYACSF
jgi:hypothetical protein